MIEPLQMGAWISTGTSAPREMFSNDFNDQPANGVIVLEITADHVREVNGEIQHQKYVYGFDGTRQQLADGLWSVRHEKYSGSLSEFAHDCKRGRITEIRHVALKLFDPERKPPVHAYSLNNEALTRTLRHLYEVSRPIYDKETNNYTLLEDGEHFRVKVNDNFWTFSNVSHDTQENIKTITSGKATEDEDSDYANINMPDRYTKSV